VSTASAAPVAVTSDEPAATVAAVPAEPAPEPAAPVAVASDEPAAAATVAAVPAEPAAPVAVASDETAEAAATAESQAAPAAKSPAPKPTTATSVTKATATNTAKATGTPKAAKSHRIDLSARGVTRGAARVQAPTRHQAPHKFGTVDYNKWYATQYMDYKYGWGDRQRSSLIKLWMHESGWNQRAHNGSSGAHGIPQALPGNKMSSHGAHWATNPETQIKWGLSYIKSRYGSPNKAWSSWQHKGWY
jgi:hypothetical protein